MNRSNWQKLGLIVLVLVGAAFGLFEKNGGGGTQPSSSGPGPIQVTVDDKPARTKTTPVSARNDGPEFDFYVLALSWSPSYCATENSPDREQCGRERHGFIVHGLWPQYESGFPEFCESRFSDRVSQQAADSISDLMPGTGLVRYQWRKHGLCTGLDQRDYFATMRKAFGRIAIPDSFENPTRSQTLQPQSIETEFLKANPGMRANGIAVTCSNGHLADVRICLTKDLKFRSCPEVDRDACRSSRTQVPGI